MSNLLLNEVEYKYDKTAWGTWRSYLYPTGLLFREFRSHGSILGWPLIHCTYGICPETGKRIVARGVIAVGRFAVGGLAIGHASLGLIAIGQAAFGLALGLGQLATGIAAVGQAALALSLGLGQLATGTVAIGQIAVGEYALGQAAYGPHPWGVEYTDPAAREFFTGLAKGLGVL
ncbi:MAG TPA: hypothetical protein P5318_16610 [Candidatus Hydrogenedentes bacterium]|nr:hypothetical protein [Candidatus Hydrogenedentota bacterium]HOV72745.1 hypothetical protein [Candidatus Hydrogenedentota bacterium]HPC17838.1 hypothetical protein [Candidatus Hydrogenedentota bacterium]HRT21739.1 hypothetical protein [Candidatus Hydrogenedentota bacterium]HRT65536.1 hypothetical protein [Candidatus Hydrogenedentota bacterium]